jgi:DNA-binding transcriptional LysR family regulator
VAGAGGIEPCNNPLPHKDFSIPARPFDSIFDSKAKALVGMTDDEAAYIEAKGWKASVVPELSIIHHFANFCGSNAGALRLRRLLPGAQVKLFELSTNDQLSTLTRGAIDIGFAHPPFGTGDRLDVFDLPAGGTIAALPDDRRDGDVRLAEIAALGLILFPAAQGPVLHARILDSFTKVGVEVRIVQEANRALTMLALVSAGLGAALLPRSIRSLAFEGVRYAEIKSTNLPHWPLAMIARRRPHAPIVRQVWRIFSEGEA